MFMHMNGTVKGQQKISATEGGLRGRLFTSELFGYSVTSLGDINGDGTTDVGTGATYDDAGSPVGAFWVVLLRPDGTVRSNRKITNSLNGFTGPLGSRSFFGIAAAFLGQNSTRGTVSVAVG